jgi:hypothetical protein
MIKLFFRDVVKLGKLAIRHRSYLPVVGEAVLRLVTARDNFGPGNPKGKITSQEAAQLGYWLVTKLCKDMNVPIYVKPPTKKKGGKK